MPRFTPIPLILAGFLFLLPVLGGCSDTPAPSTSTAATPELWGDFPHERPICVKGIHLTAWITGNKKARGRFESLFRDTELNTAVIDIKEVNGDVFIPGVEIAGNLVSRAAVPDLKDYLKYLKDRGIYTIARMTVFHDNQLAKFRPDWAVRSSSPLPKAVEKGYREDVWVDNKGSAWVDPYNPRVWDYNLDIAEQAAKLGFQGVQFDYIRFPSDGRTKLCVFSKPHSRAASVAALATFLERAHGRLKPYGVEISIDVFGLAGSYNDDLGIGQKLSELLSHVDVISPMMYPSHYAPGEYGLREPNSAPFETVYRSISDTKKVMRNKPVELRPYLQDFSLGVKYTAQMVRDQIDAAAEQGIGEWLLWNPSCRYTREALLPTQPE